MKKLFLTGLYDLIISENLGRGDRITNDLFITNDSSLIKGLVNKELEIMAGKIETDFLLNSDAIIYSKQEVKDLGFIGQDYLKRQMQFANLFLNFLWLIKDNSVGFEMAYLQYNEPRGIRIDSNYISSVYSNCHGKQNSITFNRDELKLAREIFRTGFSEEIQINHQGSQLKKGIHRVPIAFYFLQSARSNKDLAVKITFYCTCFEALFSTSNAELSHQLAERIAFFIGGNFEERRDIFKQIKEAYGIRSKIIHGDLLSPSKIDNLYIVSKNCDNLLRTILYTLLLNPELSDVFSSVPHKLDDYFTNLILGKK